MTTAPFSDHQGQRGGVENVDLESAPDPSHGLARGSTRSAIETLVDLYKASKLKADLVAKTVNSPLTVLSQLLKFAKKWDLVSALPDIESLSTPQPEYFRNDLVFYREDGAMLAKESCKHPLWRACRAANIEHIGGHVLRYAHLSAEARREAVRLLDGANDTLAAHGAASA